LATRVPLFMTGKSPTRRCCSWSDNRPGRLRRKPRLYFARTRCIPCRRGAIACRAPGEFGRSLGVASSWRRGRARFEAHAPRATPGQGVPGLGSLLGHHSNFGRKSEAKHVECGPSGSCCTSHVSSEAEPAQGRNCCAVPLGDHRGDRRRLTKGPMGSSWCIGWCNRRRHGFVSDRTPSSRLAGDKGDA
jgi:hypothetical protein